MIAAYVFSAESSAGHDTGCFCGAVFYGILVLGHSDCTEQKEYRREYQGKVGYEYFLFFFFGFSFPFQSDKFSLTAGFQ